MRRRCSIIIPTFKRKISLLRLLACISDIINDNYECIVIEQGENNKKYIVEKTKEIKLSLRYKFFSIPNTPHAMNIGVKEAKSDYILFLDDDVLITPDLVTHHLRNFTDPLVCATVGRVHTKGRQDDPNNTYTERVNWLGQVSDGLTSTVRQEVDTVIGCNTCWRKEVYEKLGGMDEQFTGNAMRLETDLSLRAKKAGYKIIYEPAAEVVHLREETGGARKTEGRLRWYFDYFSNETYFFLKHRLKILLPLFLLTKAEWGLRCMFGFGREVSMNSFFTPVCGILDGIKKYRRYYNENRC